VDPQPFVILYNREQYRVGVDLNMIYIVVGIGGVVGALLRYYADHFIHTLWPSTFPFGTLLVNFLGCFALGWFLRQTSNKGNISPYIVKGIGTGLIGSFTTFSAFSVETVELLRNGLWLSGISYVLLSLWGGLGLAWLGTSLALKKGGRSE